jgi:hypothetical protein
MNQRGLAAHKVPQMADATGEFFCLSSVEGEQMSPFGEDSPATQEKIGHLSN